MNDSDFRTQPGSAQSQRSSSQDMKADVARDKFKEAAGSVRGVAEEAADRFQDEAKEHSSGRRCPARRELGSPDAPACACADIRRPRLGSPWRTHEMIRP